MWSDECLKRPRYSTGYRHLICTPGCCPQAQGRKHRATYQYCCQECERTFERTKTISEHEVAKPQCPKCGNEKVSIVPGRGCAAPDWLKMLRAFC
jgi:putative FmdB family regulatory protein